MIGTYHYVRNMETTLFPRIKGLDVNIFRDQIQNIKKNYNIINGNELISAALNSKKKLSQNSALLSFDDGYRDHFEHVFPILIKENIKGVFFPPASTVLDGQVLDVNKIHFILASVNNINDLVKAVKDMIYDFDTGSSLKKIDEYWKQWAKPSRWDSSEVMFVKRMLQKGLPLGVRTKITDILFQKFVTKDEEDFAAELYMSRDELIQLLDAGMTIGNHGYSHNWLNNMKENDQEEDINKALIFLEDLGVNTKNWIMCYPYGGYDKSLLKILRKKKCVIGLSLNEGIADLSIDDHMILPRIDANDIYKNINKK